MNRKTSKPKIDRMMPMIHSNAAAIDVGATMHMAAVRADRTPEPVRSFGTFTADLTRVTLGKSRVRETRPPGSVRAKAKWLSYSTTIDDPCHRAKMCHFQNSLQPLPA